MKLALRSRGDELSEMQVRRDKAEKRLSDATRDGDLAREKLQRKVDDLQVREGGREGGGRLIIWKGDFFFSLHVQVMLRKKERDFEVTMEHLQADIDQLEGEKGELRDKIKDITKQTLFKQINEKMMMTSGGGSGGG